MTDGTATTDKTTLGFAPRLAALEGWNDYRVDGVALFGFLSPGISEEAHRNFRDWLQQMYFTMSYAPNAIIFQAGANDKPYPPEALQAIVIETVKVAHKYFPDAGLILLGPITSSPDLTAVNDTYARSAYEADIPYVDAKGKPITASSERARLISADGWHPNDEGHQVIAETRVAWIAEFEKRQ
ncbi:SGNH/GDSL hydrolase family protein [Rhodococcus sp. BP-149]|nr:SGNH/GDSL hydrolase family protein [Rhodococcus sp. BP-288]MBY6695278.1 SGNH/GDSL hydrolase family protein [Rhodococcus sp. BP-188]MBY6700060.1 SGNH/GDSL hydrolase family protein [Rhodococcus sp. BP-285]MBY6704917.1 SGNH/GDSL hydrolase family protein [Rhodococcus sp. BP-283]MBY6713185.1 SGNH/GDSL hydrolase family protein [Rhodococcus sp. BP-160]MBY6715675.1 SGNH/GDSL hydrolase family protein [Rhodococcus sp. BP-110]MBY6721713.1 SGNH/GDSL hydrolase family protein [Rhodococcus sp. BP-142]MB